MNSMQLIEGKEGGKFASALLYDMVVSSLEIRQNFLRFISVNANKGPILHKQIFSSLLDMECRDSNSVLQGEIDMTFSVDNAVIGIDCLLYEDDKKNYKKCMEHIENTIAPCHADIVNIQSIKWMFIIICPEYRVSEVKSHIINKYCNNGVVLTWENLLYWMNSLVESMTDSEALYQLKQFIAYIEGSLEFMPGYEQIYPYIKSDYEETGTALQRGVVKKLSRFFPNTLKDRNHRHSWCGEQFYFNEGKDRKEKDSHFGWYGFLHSNDLLNNKLNDEMQLVIVSTYCPIAIKENPEKFHLKEVGLEKGNLLLGMDVKEKYAWIVDFDETWGKAGKWHQCIYPFHEPHIQKV